MKKILITFIFFLVGFSMFGQIADCVGAIGVCETSVQNYQVTGIGIDDFPGQTGSGCLGTGGAGPMVEGNSIWFRFRASATGQLGFNIIPNDPGEDWDFAVYGPDPECGNLRDPMTSEVPGIGVCNYAGAGGNGNTGAGVDPDTGTQTGRYCPYFTVEAGSEYVLFINSWAGDNNQFTLQWTGDLVTNSGGVNPLDCSIVVGDLGPDQEVCEDEVVVLDATPSSPGIVTYRWFVDSGAGFNVIPAQTNATLQIGGAGGIPAVTGMYRAEITDLDGNMDEDDVMITFHPQPTIETLSFTTFEQCDENNDTDGISTFDLETLFNSSLLGTQDPGIFNVVYYRSQADALANMNPITTPTNYQNQVAFTSEEIFARVLVTAAPDLCNPAITSFNLLVQPAPVVNGIPDYEICDDDADGDDTNGLAQSFVLSTRDGDILGMSQDPTDYTVSYHTSAADADNDTNPLDKVNAIQNDLAAPGVFVRIENNATGCYSFSTAPLFNLVVNPLPALTNNPVTLEFCDDDTDGFSVFNLNDANPNLSANFAVETFTFYPTLADAQNDTNALTASEASAYTNQTSTNDSVWVRVITGSGCHRVAQVNMEVTNTAVPPTFQRTFEECDDYLDTNGNNNANNDDTDGITTFDFSSVTSEIEALFPTPQTVNVTYHESLADATNAVNAIPDISNHRNINSPNTQQIYIRVENPANATCLYVGTHITLIAGPVPTADAVTEMNICDNDADGDDTNGFVQNIDLENQTAAILGVQNPTNFTVTYHESAADATAGSNTLSSPYTNTVANGQTIYVRVTDNVSGCYTDRTSFDVNIRPLPIINATVELQQCDNDTDGFSNFNLNEAATDISANYMNETFEFYETLADAQAGVNAITNTTAYTNQVVSSDTVWARAISSFDCFRISEVTLTVSTTGLPTTFQRNFNTCDDFLDINGNNNANNDDTDGISTFDFSSVTQEVIDIFPPGQQLSVTYYRNEADALAELNAIVDPSNYRNIGYPNTQNIYIRVDSDVDNDCLGFGPFITLTVDPVPVANPVADLEECDNADDGDFANGFIQTFNLESQTPLILGGQDPSIYLVTYHLTAADATANTNAITNTTAYTNTTANQQTIYVRITHATQGCFVDRLTFDIIVNPLPIANFVPDLEVCDDGADGSTQNGITGNIDLSVQTAGILGSQDPSQFSVTYHTSLTDAQAGVDAITGLWENTVPFTQTIYIRVINGVTGCANGISNFNVIVHPEPTAVDVDDFMTCDDDADGDDTNGFVQNINLDSTIPTILGPDQDEDDFTVTFHESQSDATIGINALTSPYSNTTANQQTIYVRVTNNDTGCVNDDLSFDIIVNPLPDFEVTSPQIVCLNGPPLTISVENPAGIYDYVWTDPVGNMIVGSQISITTGGLYLVTGTTVDGTNCSRTREIQVNESIVATITDANVTIVDDSENNSITIDPTDLGIGDYEYALEDENGQILFTYQDSPVFENLPGGFYTILVRDKNGCGEVSLDVSVVEFPSFFTPNNDGINDTWAIRGANSTFFPDSEVNIFNRFGKVVAQIEIDNPGWDGTFNGKTLPSDDYWFAIRLIDRNGILRERKGNFSLLRR